MAADGTGSKGLYTSPLLRFIDAPDLPLETMLKHVSAAVTTVKPEPADSAAQIEQQGWAAAQSGNTVAGYTAYLQEHPQGRLQSCSPASSPGLTTARQGLQAAKRIRVGVRGAGRPEHSAIPIP